MISPDEPINCLTVNLERLGEALEVVNLFLVAVSDGLTSLGNTQPPSSETP